MELEEYLSLWHPFTYKILCKLSCLSLAVDVVHLCISGIYIVLIVILLFVYYSQLNITPAAKAKRLLETLDEALGYMWIMSRYGMISLVQYVMSSLPVTLYTS